MRIDEEMFARVDEWRSAQDDLPTRAEAMRRLIELGLARASRDSVKLSDGEKMIAVMLRDIYKQLKLTNGEIDPDFISDVIFGGHDWALKWEMQGLFHDHHDDPRALRLVVDVLDMWSFIEEAYEKLPKKDRGRIEKEAGTHVRFVGFDGNNEGEHMSIARFLVEKMERFSRFKGRDLNAHMRTLEAYRRMVSAFEPIRRTLVGHGLSASQVISILQAWTRP